MDVQDMFVGVVAICCGIWCLLCGLLNLEWSFHFWAAKSIDRRLGRGSARAFYLLLGLVLVLLGSAISFGWRLPLFAVVVN